MGLRWNLASSATVRIPTIARQMKVSRSVESLIKQKVNVTTGFAFGAFDGAVQVKPWSLTRMVESARAAVFCPSENGEAFIDANILYKNYFLFILASSMQVRKEFYDLDLVKGPVTMDVELEHIGKTSFMLKSSAFCNGMSDPIFISRVTSVFVCNEMRQPKPPPDWWGEKFSKEVPAGGKPIERLDMSDKDDVRSTESNFIVHASDVDGYLHTNWSNYIKYCSDAFVEHLVARDAVRSHEEAFRQVKDLSVVYKKESSIGDSLTTRVSPHHSDSNIFYFNIAKSRDVACECKIEYHPL